MIASRGADRELYLAKYIALQAKKKGAKLVTVEKDTNATEGYKDFIPMTLHKIRQEYGPAVAEAWKDHPKLHWDPDPITKSEDYELRQYEE